MFSYQHFSYTKSDRRTWQLRFPSGNKCPTNYADLNLEMLIYDVSMLWSAVVFPCSFYAGEKWGSSFSDCTSHRETSIPKKYGWKLHPNLALLNSNSHECKSCRIVYWFLWFASIWNSKLTSDRSSGLRAKPTELHFVAEFSALGTNQPTMRGVISLSECASCRSIASAPQKHNLGLIWPPTDCFRVACWMSSNREARLSCARLLLRLHVNAVGMLSCGKTGMRPRTEQRSKPYCGARIAKARIQPGLFGCNNPCFKKHYRLFILCKVMVFSWLLLRINES